MQRNTLKTAFLVASIALAALASSDAHGAAKTKTFERTIDGVVYVCTKTTTALKDGRLGVKTKTVCTSKGTK